MVRIPSNDSPTTVSVGLLNRRQSSNYFLKLSLNIVVDMPLICLGSYDAAVSASDVVTLFGNFFCCCW